MKSGGDTVLSRRWAGRRPFASSVALPFPVYVLGISRLRLYLIGWAAHAIVAVAASFALMPTLGLIAVPVGYGLSSAIAAIISIGWFVLRREEGLLTTMAMIVAGLVVVATQCYLAWRDELVFIQGCLFLLTSLAAAVFLWMARTAPPEGRAPSPASPQR